MSDTRHDLERGVRGFEPSADGYEKVLRRRDRRVRRRTLEATALGLVVFLLLAGSIVATVQGQRARPATGPITPSDVAQIRLVWSGQVSGPIDAPMTVAGDRLYVVSQGRLSAFPISCADAGSGCPPSWTAPLPVDGVPSTSFNLWWGAPTVSGSTVYVGAGNGQALGFPTSCTERCTPTWRAATGGTSVASPPVVVGDTVYLGVSLPNGTARLEAFPAVCASGPCTPTWFGDLPGGFTGATPVVADHMVFVGSADGTLAAFPVDCGRSAEQCAPLWHTSLEPASVGELGAMVAPLGVAQGRLFAASGNRLYSFDIACPRLGGPCPPRWTAHADAYFDGLTVVDGSVFASSFEDRALHVYPVVCSATCTPSRTISDRTQGSNALVANGVIFSSGGTSGVDAFAAVCGGSGPSCGSLWSGSTQGAVSAGLAESVDTLFVGDETGGVYAFSAHGTAVTAPTSDASSGTSLWVYLFYLALAAVLLVIAYRAIARHRERRQTTAG